MARGPIYLAEMLIPCSHSEHDLRSSFDHLLVVPVMETVTYGDLAFSVLGPSLWNNLPKKIRDSSSVTSFKNGTCNTSVQSFEIQHHFM